MAGQNQAANLGGMISQIAGTLGTPVDPSGYVKGVENTFRPNADPKNIDEMRKLAEWQQRMGRGEEARTTLVTIRDLEEKEKEARAKREGQARALAVSEYKKALTAVPPDANAVAAAEDAVMKVGEVQGFDVTNLLAGVEQRVYAAEDQKFQQEEQARLGKERQATEDRKKLTEELAVKMNGVTSVEAADALLKGTDPTIAVAASQLYDSAVSRIDKAQDRAQAETEARAQLMEVMSIPEGIPEDLLGPIEEDRNRLNDKIQELNKEIDEGGNVMLAQAQKKNLVSERQALESRMHSTHSRVVLNRLNREEDEEREVDRLVRGLEQNKRRPISIDDALKEARVIAGYDKKGDPNPVKDVHMNQARKLIRSRRDAGIDAEIAFLRGEEPAAEPEKDPETPPWEATYRTEPSRTESMIRGAMSGLGYGTR